MEDQAPYGKNEQQDSPKVVYQMTVTSFEGGNVRVKGFPLNISEALEMLLLAIKAVTDFFINAAIDGKLKREEKFVAPSSSKPNNLN